MIEVWAIYDGDTGDLAAPAKHCFRTRIQDILWDMGVDAFPNMRLVAKANARDLTPDRLTSSPLPRTSCRIALS